MSCSVVPALPRRAARALATSSILQQQQQRSASSSSDSSSETTPGTYGRRAYDLRVRLDRQQEQEEEEARAATAPPPPSSLRRTLSPSTILSHAGISPQTDKNDALSPPIELATTYGRPPDGNYGSDGKIYARTDNGTREALEDVVAKMELTPPVATPVDDESRHDSSPRRRPRSPQQPVCAAFSSGMAAVSAVLLAHPAPVHVILPDDVYHGVPTQLTAVLGRHGMTWERVDMTDLGRVRMALKEATAAVASKGREGGGSVVLWLETPSNPLCKITDIRALCDLAKDMRGDTIDGGKGEGGSGATPLVVVDSTWAPPPISNPLLLGADAVLHSGTKYLGGHSDVLLGIVTTSPFTPGGRWLGPHLKSVQASVGAVASPFDSWLTLRGMRTLHVRLERQCQSAMDLAVFLQGRQTSEGPGDVVRVHYPGLADHPGHGVARQQMSNGLYGGMLSFEVRDERTAMAVAGAVRTVRRGTSLGGTETLIEHRASIEPAGRVTSPPGLLRVSVGLEDVEDIKYDLDRALDVAKLVVPMA